MADTWRDLDAYRPSALDSLTGRDVDTLSGDEFERCVGAMFEALGYEVQCTERYDLGADLVVARDGTRTAVQVKRHDHPIGARAVQQAAAGRSYYSCDAALVVTNSTIRRQARDLAAAASVSLWDREALIERLQAAGMLDRLIEATPPTCPECGSSTLVQRGRFGQFWACSRYAQTGCRFTAEVRRWRLRLVAPDSSRGNATFSGSHRPPHGPVALPMTPEVPKSEGKHRVILAGLVFGWLTVLSIVANLIHPATGGPPPIANDIVALCLFGGLTAWGSVWLWRDRKQSVRRAVS